MKKIIDGAWYGNDEKGMVWHFAFFKTQFRNEYGMTQNSSLCGQYIGKRSHIYCVDEEDFNEVNQDTAYKNAKCKRCVKKLARCPK